MVEFTTLIAFASLIIIPSLILGFGNMVDSRKASIFLAYTNFMVLLGYFMYEGYVGDYWIIIVSIVMAIMVYEMYKSVLVGGE